MKNTKVSVCIPVYNAQDYIGETINSIINQSFENFEIIIVDNKSTDKTLEIVEKYYDSRIKVFKNDKNYGMVKNWNICLKYANGEYIQFVCADDTLERNCLEEKVNFLDKNNDVVLVFNATNIIDKNNKVIMKRKFTNKNKIIDGIKFAINSFRTRNIYGEPTNVLFRNEYAKKIGEFNEKLSYSPDWEYWMRLSKLGKIGYLNKALSNYRVVSTSSTSSLFKNKKNLKIDDEFFIKSIMKCYGRNIRMVDIVCHKLIGTIRMYAKYFLLFKISKNKK